MLLRSFSAIKVLCTRCFPVWFCRAPGGGVGGKNGGSDAGFENSAGLVGNVGAEDSIRSDIASVFLDDPVAELNFVTFLPLFLLVVVSTGGER